MNFPAGLFTVRGDYLATRISTISTIPNAIAFSINGPSFRNYWTYAKRWLGSLHNISHLI